LSLLVRRASIDDVDSLVALMREFYAEAGIGLEPGPAAAAFRAVLEEDVGVVWLAVRDGQPIGHLVLTLGFSMEFGGTRGFVDDFFVQPGERGRGVGAAILEDVKGSCAALGIRCLTVETGLEGHPARSLYHRAGFEDVGRGVLNQPLAPALHES
jgi:GNAT superfamily N-acetyltransferase